MKKLLWVLVMAFSLNAVAQGKPVLSNFRIEDSNKNRVYFDASGDISGLTKNGFVISGKTITSISITGNYFTVSSAFDFWDNNTIRLGEHTDTTDRQSTLYNFTLQYIENNIVEPTASTYKYVTTSASGGGNGDSEGTAWTLTEAFSNATSGTTVWIKAGNYGVVANLDSNNGTVTDPIKFIGYKTTIGDITSMYYSYGDGALDPTEMPTSLGGGTSNAFIKLIARNYIIVKNFQVERYGASFYANGSEGVIFDNCIAKDNNAGGWGFLNLGVASKRNRFLNGISINGNATCWVLGDRSLIKNIKSYGNLDVNPGNTVEGNVNYYFAISGDNNIAIDNYAERDGNLSHFGHGMSVHSINVTSTRYNLVENHTTVNMTKGLELRHSVIEYNVVRGLRNSGAETGGVLIRDGAGFNVVENSTLKASVMGGAIQFVESVETGVGLGHDNIIKNCIITSDVYSNVSLITVDSGTSGATGNNNKILNCTFYGAEILFNLSNIANWTFNNCEFTNNIFHTVTNGDAQSGALSGWSFDYNNFYNGFNAIGTNYRTVDPNFEGELNGNFKLKSNSPLIDKGINNNNVKYDLNGDARPQGSSNDIGAFEYQDNSTSSINADAGEDQTICLGESVTLTATGGTSYIWSNGATAASIEVNPTTTETYTVTVKEGSATDTDSVEVTVNNVTANAGSDVTINTGDSTTLTASGGDTYLWSSGENTASITVSPSATTTYKVTVTNNNCEDTANVKVTVNASSPPPTITANAGEDQEVCLGDSVILTASGGSIYLWDNGATTASITVSPTNSKTYSVTVTEGSDSDTDEVLVTVNNVTANAGSDVIINTGESTTLTASGGDTYLWSTGETTNSITISPTVTTTYKVTVTKNNCEAIDNVKVTVNASSPPPTVTANAGEDQTICLGESVTLTATGGTSYIWSNGATAASIEVNPTTTETYTVTVKEGSVTDTDSVEVTVNSVIASAGSNITINEGGSTTLTANGGDSFLWSTGETNKTITVNPLDTTIYTVTVSKDNCEDSDSVQVTVNKTPLPAEANAGKDITICIGEEAQLKASGGLTYLWSTGDTNKNITVSPTRTTTYTLIATRGDVTNSDTIVVTVENCNDNADTENLNAGFDVYPNPTTGLLNINVRNNINNDLNLILVSMNGSVVYSDKVNANGGSLSKQIDLSRFAKGIYFVRLFNTNQNMVKKILII